MSTTRSMMAARASLAFTGAVAASALEGGEGPHDLGLGDDDHGLDLLRPDGARQRLLQVQELRFLVPERPGKPARRGHSGAVLCRLRA